MVRHFNFSGRRAPKRTTSVVYGFWTYTPYPRIRRVALVKRQPLQVERVFVPPKDFAIKGQVSQGTIYDFHNPIYFDRTTHQLRIEPIGRPLQATEFMVIQTKELREALLKNEFSPLLWAARAVRLNKDEEL